MQHTKPSYYITTPIYYVNAAPHLGTAYSTILADVQARFRRACGFDVLFLTGTDEHGEKVAPAAAEHGMTPKEWCDSLVPAFKETWEKLNITNDRFMRTTDEDHIHAVQTLFENLREKGYVYKGTYDGWYCVPEETYFTETQVRHSDEEKHTEGEHLCPDCGRPLERVQEESWFFKLSAFQDQLLELYRDNPHFVEPEIRRNEVVSFVEGGLKDLSISRTSFDWGIPLPFDPAHVTYVWFDALINYITAAGYASDPEEFEYRWPAQAHIVGKDIIRFHCVIWPAMLMAAGIPVPEQVFAHGFLMVRNEETGAGEKMSKSRGNAIAPADVMDLLGIDGYRYYFMTDVKPGTDGAISWGRMEQVYNTDLANSWGNLVSRTYSMTAKYYDGKIPAAPAGWETRENPLRAVAEGLPARYAKHMEVFAYDEAAKDVMELVSAANHYIEDTAPFSLAKDPEKADELAAVMCDLLAAIRICAHLYLPFMPETSAEALRRMSAEDEIESDDLFAACEWKAPRAGEPIVKGAALFPRLVDQK
jgi:methionyl-tRNA synthetase